MENSQIATDFTSLTSWQKSRKLVVLVYHLTDSYRDFTLKDQLRRAVVSVMNNLAEGYSRNSNKDTQHFFNMSMASCCELKSMTYILEDLQFSDQELILEVRSKAIEVHKMIRAFIKYLQKKTDEKS
jgi:four helix bundle protein